MKAHILVVDDEPPMRDLCLRMLTAQGYSVDLAANGNNALAMMAKTTYDLVLSDLKMPGDVNGIDLVSAIERVSPTTDVILMTGYPTFETETESFKHGASGYLVKPFFINEAMEAINTCIDARFLKQSFAA